MEDNTATSAFFDEISYVLAPEGRVAAKKCVGDDAKGPHVDRLAMALFEHNLGCCITERASHGRQHTIRRVKHFGNTKICEDKRGLRVFAQVKEVLRL